MLDAIALKRLAGIVLLAGLIAGCEKEPPPAPADPVAEAEKAAPSPVGEALVKLYFDPSVADLPVSRRIPQLTPAAQQEIVKVIEAAQAQPGKTVLLTPYYDADANPNNDADYSRQRAAAVKNYLSASGVQEARILSGPPQVPPRGSNPNEASRVDIRLQ